MIANEETKKILESVLKANLKQLDASAQLARNQQQQLVTILQAIDKQPTIDIPAEWKQMIMSTNDYLEKQSNNDVVLGQMIEGMQSMQSHISELTNTVNSLIQLTSKNQQHMSAIQETFVDNTARLNALVLSIASSNGNASLEDIFMKLAERT